MHLVNTIGQWKISSGKYSFIRIKEQLVFRNILSDLLKQKLGHTCHAVTIVFRVYLSDNEQITITQGRICLWPTGTETECFLISFHIHNMPLPLLAFGKWDLCPTFFWKIYTHLTDTISQCVLFHLHVNICASWPNKSVFWIIQFLEACNEY